MEHFKYARASTSLEEALTILFCLVDDVYQNINPNSRRYESLKKLSDSEVITLALFQQLRGLESQRSFFEMPKGSSCICFLGWRVCTPPRSIVG